MGFLDKLTYVFLLTTTLVRFKYFSSVRSANNEKVKSMDTHLKSSKDRLNCQKQSKSGWNHTNLQANKLHFSKTHTQHILQGHIAGPFSVA
jgi:hypothetical protein